MFKTCGKCGEEKQKSEFNKNNTSKDGLQHHCRECQRKYDLNRKLKLENEHEKGQQILCIELLEDKLFNFKLALDAQIEHFKDVEAITHEMEYEVGSLEASIRMLKRDLNKSGDLFGDTEVTNDGNE